MELNDIDKLFKIINAYNPKDKIRKNESFILDLIPELKYCIGFNQKNDWHIYDVYNHTLNVINNTPRFLDVRLAALFHDIGKPNTFTLDKDNIGHFFGHWDESMRIYSEFATRNNIDVKISNIVNSLIYYHDLNISKLDEQELNKLFLKLDISGIKKLYILKRADILAQNSKYKYKINEYNKEEEKVLKKVIR